MRTVIVYVHGLWFSGRESAVLRGRLARELHAETVAFSYTSVIADAHTNAKSLGKFLNAISADVLHLVGHSLGGVLILRLFEDGVAACAQLPPGRIVLMGAPLRGSRAAQGLWRTPFGKKILGCSVGDELLISRTRVWNGARDLGVIAGCFGLGLGRMFGTGGAPSDGTVLVDETSLDGATDRLVLRVSHTGMLFSAEVAKQAGAFLSTGRFARK